MKYVLSYVNLPIEEVYLDMEFTAMDKLVDYVKETYPDFTSYQIIVVKPLAA